MKEIIILWRHYFNWHWYLTNTNFPLPQVLNVSLEKTGNINIHTKFAGLATKFQIIHFSQHHI